MNAPAPRPAPPLVTDVEGRGPAVVLLHGQPGTAADWNAVVPLLADRYTVLAPDRPGYGRTGGRAGGFGLNADAVVALLDRHGIDQAIVVGHSWAGAVAIRMAETDPERVAGLVLAASVDPDDPPKRVDRLLASRPVGDLAAAVAIAAAARLLLAPPVWRRLEPRLAAPTRTALGALLRRNAPSPVWRSFSDEQRAYVQEVAELGPDLAGIGCPVVILVGETDHVVAPTAGARLAVAIPGATLTSVPGTGHLLPHDAPRAVSDAVDDVAGRVSAP